MRKTATRLAHPNRGTKPVTAGLRGVTIAG